MLMSGSHRGVNKEEDRMYNTTGMLTMRILIFSRFDLFKTRKQSGISSGGYGV
jgi:hypothetical protein